MTGVVPESRTVPTTATQPTRKTPTDFTREADEYHNDLSQAAAAAATAQSKLDALAEHRNMLIAEARDYGLTPAYARTLLRKP